MKKTCGIIVMISMLMIISGCATLPDEGSAEAAAPAAAQAMEAERTPVQEEAPAAPVQATTENPIQKLEEKYDLFFSYVDNIEYKDYSLMMSIPLQSKDAQYADTEVLDIVYHAYSDSEVGITPNILFYVKYTGNDWRFMEGDLKIKTDTGLITMEDPFSTPYRCSLESGKVMEVLHFADFQLSGREVTDLYGSDSIRLQYWLNPVDIDAATYRYIKFFIDEFYGKSFEELKQLYPSGT